jgi:hypothetical protein
MLCHLPTAVKTRAREMKTRIAGGQQVRPGAPLQTADCRLQIAKRIAEDRPCFKHKKHNYMYLLL